MLRPLHVLKFGGTSLGNLQRIQRVAEIIIEKSTAANIVVVVSAMSGETDRLYDLAYALSQSPAAETLDTLVSSGEQISAALLTLALEEKGMLAESLLGWQIPIILDSVHQQASIQSIDCERIHQALRAGKIPVIAGFQGVTLQGKIATLGRGGSDTSAVAIAAALHADACLIFTDVNAVYTADPRIVAEALPLETMPVDTMLALAEEGAKVLHPRAAALAGKYKIPTCILSTFAKKQEGTWLVSGPIEPNTSAVTNISGKTKLCVFTVQAYAEKNAAAKICSFFEKNNIFCTFFESNTIAGIEYIHCCLERNVFADIQVNFTAFLSQNELNVLHISKKAAKVSVLGEGLSGRPDIMHRIFEVLNQRAIPVAMAHTTNIKVSVIIDENYLETAIRALHSALVFANPEIGNSCAG